MLAILILLYDHGEGVLKFSDAATAGKAQLSLDGAGLDRRKLKTGSLEALFHEMSETRIKGLYRDSRRHHDMDTTRYY